jgi:alkylhydroperoxidase family enzyme
MARVKPVFKPSDYPGTPDEATKKALSDLFEQVFPGQANPEISGDHGGFAVVARKPRLALHLMKLSDYIVREMPWTSQRRDLRELAAQTLNLHFKSEYSFQAHLAPAQRYGITLEQQALLPLWRTATVFNEEQRLVIEYTQAVIAGDVPAELFSRVVSQFGEEEAIECTVGIAWWSFWAMVINATGIEFDFGYGKPGPG